MRLIVLLTVCGCLLAAEAWAAPAWPTTDSTWNALMVGSDYYSDPVGPKPGTTDIVGDTTTYAAGFYYQDENSGDLMFRMRISEQGSKAKAVWQVLLDTDADTDVDWALQVIQSGGDTRVALNAATTGGTTYDDVVLAGTDSWTGALATWSQWTNTGANNFGKKDDWWIDVAIPWADFSSLTGLGGGDTFRVALSTSTAHTNIVKDLPQSLTGSSNVSLGWSEPITTHAPEPGTWLSFAVGAMLLFGAGRRRFRQAKAKAPDRGGT